MCCCVHPNTHTNTAENTETATNSHKQTQNVHSSPMLFPTTISPSSSPSLNTTATCICSSIHAHSHTKLLLYTIYARARKNVKTHDTTLLTARCSVSQIDSHVGYAIINACACVFCACVVFLCASGGRLCTFSARVYRSAAAAALAILHIALCFVYRQIMHLLLCVLHNVGNTTTSLTHHSLTTYGTVQLEFPVSGFMPSFAIPRIPSYYGNIRSGRKSRQIPNGIHHKGIRGLS